MFSARRFFRLYAEGQLNTGFIMKDQFQRASASLPSSLRAYVAPAPDLEAPRAIPPAERIIRQLTAHIKVALATRGTGDDRSFEVDVTATSNEEQDLATALWALHKCGYSAVAHTRENGRRVVALSW
jgi:hypothetical protein